MLLLMSWLSWLEERNLHACGMGFLPLLFLCQSIATLCIWPRGCCCSLFVSVFLVFYDINLPFQKKKKLVLFKLTNLPNQFFSSSPTYQLRFIVKNKNAIILYFPDKLELRVSPNLASIPADPLEADQYCPEPQPTSSIMKEYSSTKNVDWF